MIFIFVVFQRCFWSKITKKQPFLIKNWHFWLFNNFWTIQIGSFLTKIAFLSKMTKNEKVMALFYPFWWKIVIFDFSIIFELFKSGHFWPKWRFWWKIDIFDLSITVQIGPFLTKMDNLRRRKCSKFWFDESKCRHIMKHDMLWMRWLNLLRLGLYMQTGFIMIRIVLVSNTL